LFWDCGAPPESWGCAPGLLSIVMTSPEGHDHLPLGPDDELSLTALIRSGIASNFPLPDEDGHSHDLNFDGPSLSALATGSVTRMSTATNGHTHTYSVECRP
jgi:hypothetical protein